VRSCLALTVAAALGFVQASPALAYLKFGYAVDGTQVALSWKTTPVPYFVSDAIAANVPIPAFQAAVARAFATWEAVPTASISYRFAGYTGVPPGDDDGRSTLGFLNEPALDRVLAATSLLVDEQTGAILESDIFFNAAFAWSTAPAGEANRWDVETIALHEIGHFSGLGHSAIGETEVTATGRRMLSSEAVMFPIALGPGNIAGRDLDADDIAGISDLYPDGSFNRSTGSISGRVTRGGRGVFGAHVVAFDPVARSLVGTFTLNTAGEFSIAGLAPGPHIIRVEPLDDADIDSFFDVSDAVDIGFRATFADRLVVVPRGGDSGFVDVAVDPK
jgi:hypothetical protein